VLHCTRIDGNPGVLPATVRVQCSTHNAIQTQGATTKRPDPSALAHHHCQ
jgi:hypothetical protein